jgi:sulfur carrier protein ThiS
MQIYLHKTKETLEGQDETVQALLDRLAIDATTVLVIVDGELVTEDAPLSGVQRVEILPVASGG